MKRSDFPTPFSVGLVDINSSGAYADIGVEPRSYPRFMPSTLSAISTDEIIHLNVPP